MSKHEHEPFQETNSGTLHSAMHSKFGNRAPVPAEHRGWAIKMAKEFGNEKPEILEPLLTLLRKIKELPPEKASDFAGKIGDFFHGIRDGVKNDRNNSQAFFDQITAEVEEELKKNLN
jgi:hypothetical protein